MKCYVNDLSLNGQYQTARKFLEDLQLLMSQRKQMPFLTKSLFCSRLLHTRPVTQSHNFRTAVQTDKNITQVVLAWVTKNGPFCDDDRLAHDDDYFECFGNNVTDQGLGEAARRNLAGQSALSLSFAQGGFDFTPIAVTHGLPEDPLCNILIENLWEFLLLHERMLDSFPFPVNWSQMIEQSQARFNSLEFSPSCIDTLMVEPFSSYVVERSFELLRILNDFMKFRNEDGTFSEKNHELIEQHFSGSKSWFSDESETNKRDFKDDMSFPDFENSSKNIFCPWHGKIKSPQYRIHFEWPISSSRQKLRVFYIGPKITKN